MRFSVGLMLAHVVFLIGCLGGELQSDAKSIRQIVDALLNFELEQGHFPGDTSHLSWRVQLLSKLKQSALAEQFKAEQPWNGKGNKQWIEATPEVYLSPNSNLQSSGGKSSYVMPTGKGLFNDPTQEQPRMMSSIRDGTSTTIVLIEVEDSLAVPWTKPGDLQIDLNNPKKPFENDADGKILVAMVDGSVYSIDLNEISSEEFGGLLTVNGQEILTLRGLQPLKPWEEL